jgi:serine/threonine protein kinase
MAPEIIYGTKYDTKAEIFSLGVIFMNFLLKSCFKEVGEIH